MRAVRFVSVILATVIAGVAVVLAATESTGGKSPNEQFAESVCATTIPYGRQMIEILEDSVRTRATPGRDGWFDLYALTYQAESVALEYGKEIRALDIPDIESRAKIAGYLEFSSRHPQESLNDERHRVFKLRRHFTLLQSVRGLNHFERAIMPLVINDMAVSVEPYAVQVAPDLADAFPQAASCKKLDRVLKTKLT